MFIDNIKYTLTTFVVAIFSLTFVASCGSAESEAHVATDPTSPEEIVPEILHRISGGACDQIPYGICLTAAHIASEGHVRNDDLLQAFLEKPTVLRFVSTAEDRTNVLELMQNFSLEEVWRQLHILDAKEEFGLLGSFIKVQIEMYLLATEFERTLSTIDWFWMEKNERTYVEAMELCFNKQNEVNPDFVSFAGFCDGLRGIDDSIVNLGAQGYGQLVAQGGRVEVRAHKKYLSSLLDLLHETIEQMVVEEQTTAMR